MIVPGCTYILDKHAYSCLGCTSRDTRGCPRMYGAASRREAARATGGVMRSAIFACLVPMAGRQQSSHDLFGINEVQPLLCGCMTWVRRADHYALLRTTHHRLLLRVIGYRRVQGTYQQLSYAKALEKTGSQCVEAIIRQ
ncbi:unnamed protein product, partial [Pylaiella littoralis]